MPTNNFVSIAEQIEEQKWRKQFLQLLQFKEESGMLPSRRTDNKLFNWLVMQRKKAKNGELTQEQLKLYQEAGINVLGRPKKDEDASLN